jgi:cyclic beta-1,2-glucan synthetase
LYSADQMALHGEALAAAHKLIAGQAPDRLLARLAENESTLVDVCALLTTAATESRRIMPAGEWLLDNFYLIEEQIRTAKRHLPEGYSRELPRLAHGPSAGRPRVYDIALETIAHGDGRVDMESLSGFVAAYQSVSPMKLGELWAIPIMLRLAVIENLRRVGVRIAAGWAERNLAADLGRPDDGDRSQRSKELDPGDRRHGMLGSADGRRLRRGTRTALAGTRPHSGTALDLDRAAAVGVGSDHRAPRAIAENQQQAADQVSISNSIGSLRVLGATDWRAFVETQSVVEHAG